MQDQIDPLQEGLPSISLREYGDILRRRRAIILQTFVIILVAGVLYTLFSPPTYRATARLLVEAPTFQIVQSDPGNALGDLYKQNQMYNVPTQVELLKAPGLNSMVAEKLNGKRPAMTIEPINGTQIIEVTAEGESPEAVAAWPNTLLDMYVNTTSDVAGQELTVAQKFMDNQYAQYQSSLDKAQTRLKNFRQAHNVSEIAKNYSTQESEVQLLTDENAKLTTSISENSARSLAIQQQLASQGGVNGTVPQLRSILADPDVNNFQNQIAERNAALSALRQVYTEDNDRVKSVEAEIKIIQGRLDELKKGFDLRNARANPAIAGLLSEGSKLDVDRAGLTAQQAQVAGRLAAAQERLKNFPQWLKESEALENDVRNAKQQRDLFQARRTDVKLRSAVRKKNASIEAKAEVPVNPIRPQKAQNIFFAAILGIFLGLCLALLQEFLDDRVNSPDEADRILRLPNLGHIPVIEEEGLRLIRDIDTFSPILESYRSLRTNINFAAIGNPVRSLVITSSGPGEGKSTTVANLAMAMALNGKRVIVVDADLRRPAQHKLFNLPGSPGLTDILVGTHSISDVLRPTNVDRVSVITAGSVPPNPAELIGSAAMAHFIAALRATADIILFDSPPTLAVADAVLLSSRVDGVLLVIGFGETRKTQARQARELLSRARANVLGTILNKMDDQSSGYYYGKYYLPTTDTAGGGEGDPRKNGAHAAVNGSEDQKATAAIPADTHSKDKR